MKYIVAGSWLLATPFEIVRTPSAEGGVDAPGGWKSLPATITHSGVLVAWATLCGNAFMSATHVEGARNAIFVQRTLPIAHQKHNSHIIYLQTLQEFDSFAYLLARKRVRSVPDD